MKTLVKWDPMHMRWTACGCPKFQQRQKHHEDIQVHHLANEVILRMPGCAFIDALQTD